MKKIMFNDRYGLTDAVLQGRKTMTRRFPIYIDFVGAEWDGDGSLIALFSNDGTMYDFKSKYKMGEVVAVAQSYHDAHVMGGTMIKCDKLPLWADKSKGWNNKMFVQSDLMPHQIRITNIRLERLRDISSKDCMREGIEEYMDVFYNPPTFYYGVGGKITTNTPREAFAALIDKISGKGTWQKNPWVFVYEFELIK